MTKAVFVSEQYHIRACLAIATGSRLVLFSNLVSRRPLVRRAAKRRSKNVTNARLMHDGFFYLDTISHQCVVTTVGKNDVRPLFPFSQKLAAHNSQTEKRRFSISFNRSLLHQTKNPMPSRFTAPSFATMTPLMLLVFPSFLSMSQAAGVRGALEQHVMSRVLSGDDSHPSANSRNLDLINDYNPSNKLDCYSELNMEIICHGDCDFANQRGTCESKMFQYHGGTCNSRRTVVGATEEAAAAAAAAAAVANSDSAASCQDFHGGPPKFPGQESFIVISDAADPSKNSSMWATVGGFFWTDYEDYPIGDGLSDRHNITIYSSNETTFENMLQTMIFYAPCEGPEGFLEQLDMDQSVQLIGTAVDPYVYANLDITITSWTNRHWNLQRVTLASNAEPPYHFQELNVSSAEIPMSKLLSDQLGVTIPWRNVPIERNHRLVVLTTATAITPMGTRCTIDTLYDSNGMERS
jgi:hypothetical protein